MKKKLVAMLLITAVCGTTLAGCGGGGTDNSAKNKIGFSDICRTKGSGCRRKD